MDTPEQPENTAPVPGDDLAPVPGDDLAPVPGDDTAPMTDHTTKAAMWVFGYGSLVWNPEFPVAEQVVARLHGYARSFCMSSIHHRGTPDAPGLVLALDERPDQICTGVALRVQAGHEAATLDMLRERELVSSAYVERNLSIELDDGRHVTAVSYVIDQAHEQYLRDLDLETQARIIAAATGGRGPNDEYLFNTTSHLAQLGIADADLDWLATRVRDLKDT